MSDVNNFNDLYSNGSRKSYTNEYDNNNIIDGSSLRKVLQSNGIFSKKSIADNQYNKFNRFGYVDPYNTRTANKELLFFTKPDLNIFGDDDTLDNISVSASASSLNPKLKEASTLFYDASTRYYPVLKQLQYHADKTTPFMCLLSNRVSSSLELPGINSEQVESAANAYGTTISYRGHSIKADQACTFSLSFNDSAYLEVYMLAKLYDEYHRLIKLGRIQPKTNYIINKILDDQFSIYKFIIAEDGETILYWAKVTGVYITDVPRSDFSEFPQDGVKFSLSFYGQFVEDMDPVILSDFNRVSFMMNKGNPINTYDAANGIVDNRWVARPCIEKEKSERRAGDKLGNIIYKMKWYN